MEIDRTLRHDAMNVINALRLNLDALSWSDSDADRLECLDAIEQVADQGGEWADRYEKTMRNAE